MPLIVPDVKSSGSTTEKWTNLLMGKKLSDDQHNETHFAKKELPQNHRVVQDGGMVTMDHQPDRLNVHLDKDGTVRKVTHG